MRPVTLGKRVWTFALAGLIVLGTPLLALHLWCDDDCRLDDNACVVGLGACRQGVGTIAFFVGIVLAIVWLIVCWRLGSARARRNAARTAASADRTPRPAAPPNA